MAGLMEEPPPPNPVQPLRSERSLSVPTTIIPSAQTPSQDVLIVRPQVLFPTTKPVTEMNVSESEKRHVSIVHPLLTPPTIRIKPAAIWTTPETPKLPNRSSLKIVRPKSSRHGEGKNRSKKHSKEHKTENKDVSRMKSDITWNQESNGLGEVLGKSNPIHDDGNSRSLLSSANIEKRVKKKVKTKKKSSSSRKVEHEKSNDLGVDRSAVLVRDTTTNHLLLDSKDEIRQRHKTTKQDKTVRESKERLSQSLRQSGSHMLVGTAASSQQQAKKRKKKKKSCSRTKRNDVKVQNGVAGQPAPMDSIEDPLNLGAARSSEKKRQSRRQKATEFAIVYGYGFGTTKDADDTTNRGSSSSSNLAKFLASDRERGSMSVPLTPPTVASTDVSEHTDRIPNPTHILEPYEFLLR
jgi:hypothetical protein